MQVGKKKGIAFSQVVEDGNTIIEADASCTDATKVMSPISFKLENTQISINPRGYTYSLNDNICRVAI